MAEYYQTTIIPARVRHSKDKPSVEGNVGHISTWINASLRNEKFFSLTELNKVVKEKLDVVNTKPFQKRKGNRKKAFLEEERFAVIPLPHIKVDNNYYSVPYDYIKCLVDVRVTRNIIEVFYKNIHISSRKRLNKSSGEPQLALPPY